VVLISLRSLSVFFAALRAKDHVSTAANLGATIVYVYNPASAGEIGHKLPIAFNGVTTTGPSLDAKRFWPAAGDTVIASGPTLENKRSGVTGIAEFSRNVGLERGATYTFTETVDLPGIGPKVFLVQKVLGKSVITGASNSWVGIWAPELGVQEELYDDTAWHRVAIEQPAGTWLFEFCSYHSRTLPTQVASLDLYATFADSSINSSIAGRVVSSLWQVSCGMLGMGVGVAVASAGEGGKFEFKRNKIGIPVLSVEINDASIEQLQDFAHTLKGVLEGDVNKKPGAQLLTPKEREGSWRRLLTVEDALEGKTRRALEAAKKNELKAAAANDQGKKEAIVTKYEVAQEQAEGRVKQEMESIRKLKAKDDERIELQDFKTEVQRVKSDASLTNEERKLQMAAIKLKAEGRKGAIKEVSRTFSFSPEWDALIKPEDTDPGAVAQATAEAQEKENKRIEEQQERERKKEEKRKTYLTSANVAGAAVVVTLTLAAIAALTIAPTPFANMLYKISYLPKELVGAARGSSVRTQGSGV